MKPFFSSQHTNINKSMRLPFEKRVSPLYMLWATQTVRRRKAAFHCD